MFKILILNCQPFPTFDKSCGHLALVCVTMTEAGAASESILRVDLNGSVSDN